MYKQHDGIHESQTWDAIRLGKRNAKTGDYKHEEERR